MNKESKIAIKLKITSLQTDQSVLEKELSEIEEQIRGLETKRNVVKEHIKQLRITVREMTDDINAEKAADISN